MDWYKNEIHIEFRRQRRQNRLFIHSIKKLKYSSFVLFISKCPKCLRCLREHNLHLIFSPIFRFCYLYAHKTPLKDKNVLPSKTIENHWNPNNLLLISTFFLPFFPQKITKILTIHRLFPLFSSFYCLFSNFFHRISEGWKSMKWSK